LTTLLYGRIFNWLCGNKTERKKLYSSSPVVAGLASLLFIPTLTAEAAL